MPITLKSVGDLTDVEWFTWQDLHDQATTPPLESPFFHPEFTRVVHAARGDVEVAVLEEGGEPVGFFPFQRGPGGVAQAVCGRLSEFHGVLGRPGLSWDAVELLRTCRLTAWYFDHLPTDQAPFQRHAWGQATSPHLDLSDGYEAYRAGRKKSGSQVSQTERKGRKLEREVGPLRFEYQSDDEAAFEKLVEWKSAQHRQTGMLEVMRNDWVLETMRSVRDARANGFEGAFSVLYAGDRVAAVHLGLVSRASLHMWFPAYDDDLQKYSPGTVLLLKLAEECAERGLQRIDLGRGGERYKQSFKSHDFTIWEGSVDRHALRRSLRHAWYGTKMWIRSTDLGQRFEPALEATKTLRQWAAFR